MIMKMDVIFRSYKVLEFFLTSHLVIPKVRTYGNLEIESLITLEQKWVYMIQNVHSKYIQSVYFR